MKINENEYSIILSKSAALVTKKIKDGAPLNEAEEEPLTVIPFSEISKVEVPFMIYGLPAELKEYIKKNAKSVFPDIETKYPNIVISIQFPQTGGIMDIFKEDKDFAEDAWSLFNDGRAYMTFEESLEYRKHFLADYTIYGLEQEEAEKTILKELKELGIKN